MPHKNASEVTTVKNDVKFITRAAMIAAIYAALTLLLAPISFGFTGSVQFRIAEALTVLPLFMTEAVPGLAIGCLAANLLAGASIFDVVFGSAATLIAALVTRRMRKKPLAAMAAPAVFNGLIVGPVVYFCYFMGSSPLSVPLLIMNCLSVAFGEIVVVYTIGMVLYKSIDRITIDI